MKKWIKYMLVGGVLGAIWGLFSIFVVSLDNTNPYSSLIKNFVVLPAWLSYLTVDFIGGLAGVRGDYSLGLILPWFILTLMIGLVTPVSLVLLYTKNRQEEKFDPRIKFALLGFWYAVLSTILLKIVSSTGLIEAIAEKTSIIIKIMMFPFFITLHIIKTFEINGTAMLYAIAVYPILCTMIGLLIGGVVKLTLKSK